MNSAQTDGIITVRTSREGELAIPCSGYVREMLTSGVPIVLGDVALTQQDRLNLEPAIAALTEYMVEQTPAVYDGTYYPQRQENANSPRAAQIKRHVRIMALAGSKLRFTTEGVNQDQRAR